jgi:hypothetical protein
MAPMDPMLVPLVAAPAALIITIIFYGISSWAARKQRARKSDQPLP